MSTPRATRPRPARLRRSATTLSVTALLLTTALVGAPTRLAGLAPASARGTQAEAPSPASRAAPSAATSAGRPNVVFVLTDDLSRNLVKYMPHVVALKRTGTSFGNYTVTDSLCCPSRSSIFSGKFPHDTHVFTNTGPDGGFHVFHSRGEESETFATALHGVGYRTAMMGKYLNGYEPAATLGGSTTYVPPGWDEWDVAGNGYPEYDYNLNHDHALEHYGHSPADYLTNVISARGSDFIRSSAAAHKPFLLELATFAPHGPYTPAPRDRRTFPGLRAPRGPAFDRLPTHPPSWLASRTRLTASETANIDNSFRKRVQAVQSVDRMIGSLESTLARAGVARNTVIVFSSDNGYHMGQYRLTPGKQTAFDTDINVPLVLSGPGIRAGKRVMQPAQNIDLAPTFEALGGARTPADVDGRSLLPLLRHGGASNWRDAALVEHHGPVTAASDPDLPPRHSGNPPSYHALRTPRFTYVEYVAGGRREYYDLRRDPHELHNLAGSLSAGRRAFLHRSLAALVGCHGAVSCWRAAHIAD